MILQINQELEYTRSFTKEEILAFGKISGDQGEHHTAAPTLMAQGLLIASLPTRIGGGLNYIARKMDFEFFIPVYENDIIRCIAKVESFSEEETKYRCSFSYSCSNQEGKIVMKGATAGIIRKNASL